MSLLNKQKIISSLPKVWSWCECMLPLLLYISLILLFIYYLLLSIYYFSFVVSYLIFIYLLLFIVFYWFTTIMKLKKWPVSWRMYLFSCNISCLVQRSPLIVLFHCHWPTIMAIWRIHTIRRSHCQLPDVSFLSMHSVFFVQHTHLIKYWSVYWFVSCGLLFDVSRRCVVVCVTPLSITCQT